MNKKVSKLLAIVLALSLAATLVACGGNNQPGTTQPGNNQPGTTQPGNTQPSGDAGKENLPTYDFTFAHPFPATHQHQVEIIEPLVQELAEKSDGRMVISIVPGGAITTAASAIDDATTGAVEMMWTVAGYTPGRFPLTDMIEFPHQFTSAGESTAVLWDLLENNAEFQNEYKDFKVFNMFTPPPADVFNDVRPITKPADLNGVTLRSSSQMLETTLKLYGANTATMGIADAYDNIDRGVVDGIATDATAIPTYKLYEVLRYGTKGLNMNSSVQLMAMSLKAWNSLAPEDQELFESVTCRDLGMKSAKVFDDLQANAWEKCEELGLEIYTLTPDEEAVFKEKSAPMVAAAIAERNAKGYDAQGFYDQLIAFRDARR